MHVRVKVSVTVINFARPRYLATARGVWIALGLTNLYFGFGKTGRVAVKSGSVRRSVRWW